MPGGLTLPRIPHLLSLLSLALSRDLICRLRLTVEPVSRTKSACSRRHDRSFRRSSKINNLLAAKTSWSINKSTARSIHASIPRLIHGSLIRCQCPPFITRFFIVLDLLIHLGKSQRTISYRTIWMSLFFIQVRGARSCHNCETPLTDLHGSRL